MMRIQISLFFRKPRADENYSIERLFDAVSKALPNDRYEVRCLVCPFESKGMLRRLLIVFWAAFNQSDINHVTGDVNFLGLLLRRPRTVLTIHDSASMLRLTGLKRWIYGWIWLRLPIMRAGRVTVISESTLLETLEYCKGYSSKFRIIPNCVTGRLSASTKSFNNRRPRILQIGTRENKNLVRVIEALTGIPCLLVIVGPLTTEQIQLLNDRSVIYENYPSLDNAPMAQQYQLADVVVFVSTYEGFGLPILEAQTVGRAVVTSARAPMDKVAGTGAALVNPDDVAEIRAAINRIVEDESYRSNLVAAGFENVKKYSPEAIAAEYAAVYEELFEQGQHS
jgi:glycosyltransferase involved in cell wall biosynthesis